MSKGVSAKSNLIEARKVRESGFNSKIDRYPDVMADIRAMVAENKAKIQIYKTILERYPNYDLPSKSQFYIWIDKHGAEKIVVELSVYDPDYQAHMKEYDTFREMHWALKELKLRYLDGIELEKKFGGLQQRVNNEILKMIIEKSIDVANLEIRLNLRSGESDTPKTYIGTQNNTLKVDGRGGEYEEADEITELARRVDGSIAGFLKSQGILTELRQVGLKASIEGGVVNQSDKG